MSLQRISTGIPGLDEVLNGGLLPGRAYLTRGGAGTGKTITGLHFLIAGAAQGEPVLFITLSEPEAQIRQNAERIGLNLEGVTFLDLTPTPEFFARVETYDIFSPAEVEREPITRQIIETVEQVRPRRVFVDALTHFRYLAPDVYQYRRQVLSFLRFLTEKGITVLFTSESSPEAPDADLQFLADGVIELRLDGGDRTVQVLKFRGSDFRSGPHSLCLGSDGVRVYPRLVPEVHRREFVHETIPFGVPELDELLHGGLERGTVTIISGPSGTGKTTLALQFMKEAAGRGERSVVYTFEESVDILKTRCESVNIPVGAMMQKGVLHIQYVEPLLYAPDQFANLVRQEVEERDARIVTIDSVAGYRLAMRGADPLTHLHALGKYLSNMGVTTLLIVETETIVGSVSITEIGASYMADNILFLRHLEIGGQLRKAIGVIKKRVSDFEKTLREIEITRYGIKVGPPLTNLRGILTGVPEWAEAQQ